ncbi:hypothetical protein [Desulfosporosinus sp. SB140]|uniref:hypothetical protein n=1 Tax=Desulfosporosinus paludis TaxID=3115649 RepID=UPI00388EE972
MIEISVDNLKQVQEAFKDTPKRVNTVLARAVNRAVTNAKANMAKEASSKYVVKSRDVKLTIDTVKATAANPSGTVRSKGNRIDFVDFKLSPKNLFKGANDYKIQITRSGGWKKVPGFAAESTKWGLCVRQGIARYPWRRLMGPSVPQMIGNKEVIGVIEREAELTLNARIAAELNYELNVKSKK